MHIKYLLKLSSCKQFEIFPFFMKLMGNAGLKSIECCDKVLYQSNLHPTWKFTFRDNFSVKFVHRPYILQSSLLLCHPWSSSLPNTFLSFVELFSTIWKQCYMVLLSLLSLKRGFDHRQCFSNLWGGQRRRKEGRGESRGVKFF